MSEGLCVCRFQSDAGKPAVWALELSPADPCTEIGPVVEVPQ